MKWFRKRMNKKGFTLIELIIVIAILGILAALAIPRFLGFTDRADIQADEQYAALYGNAAIVFWAADDISVSGTAANDTIVITSVTGGTEAAPNDTVVVGSGITLSAGTTITSTTATDQVDIAAALLNMVPLDELNHYGTCTITLSDGDFSIVYAGNAIP